MWRPSERAKRRANVSEYVSTLEGEGLEFDGYNDLWAWSVRDLEAFWESVFRFNRVESSGDFRSVLSTHRMPGAKWFEGARLNYAEHVFRSASSKRPALISNTEARGPVQLSWRELRRKTAALASALTTGGVKRGDRVAAYLSNGPEAVVGLLASASIGAVWSCCSPDFGAASVIERFRQIGPKVLFASAGYDYNGKHHDRKDSIEQIQVALPSLRKTVVVPYGDREQAIEGSLSWEEFLEPASELRFERVPFDHPLWVLFSSGTTGPPKPIVHGHGGILLEHLKALSFHNDIREGDRFFWFTTTGWMMWNYLVSGLLLGSTVVLYDGSPAYPDANCLWRLAEETEMTFLGASAAFIAACMKARIEPEHNFELRGLRGIGSTGSPLSAEGFRWVYEQAKNDVWLVSLSGGTDLCTAFVGGCPLLPVYAGEIQCRCLGASVKSYDEDGKPVSDEVGELVLTEPMPSMPLYFWGDTGGRKYRESYFETFRGVWRHGDWIEIKSRGSCIIYGRSDATLKRMGVRLGTSEIYRVVESVPGVEDSLVVDLEGLGGRSYMPLFVVLKKNARLTLKIRKEIENRIRKDISPKYVPDEIFRVRSVPKTLNGKKLEVPVRRILLGMDPTKVANRDALSNPDALDEIVQLAKSIQGRRE